MNDASPRGALASTRMDQPSLKCTVLVDQKQGRVSGGHDREYNLAPNLAASHQTGGAALLCSPAFHAPALDRLAGRRALLDRDQSR